MIQSLQRAMEILNILKLNNSNCSIAKLATELSLPPSTVHRILQSLCAERFVTKDEKSRDYRLGPALISLGQAASKSINLQGIAHQALVKLSNDTKEDSFLVIPTGYKGVVIDRVDGPNPLKIVEEFGYEIELHKGAIRKALFAYQDDVFVDKYISEVLQNNNRQEIENMIEQIRNEKIAVSHGDYVKNTIGIGAPLFDSLGKAIASIGIVAPKARAINNKNLEKLKNSVSFYAAEVSRDMGYTE